MEVTFSPTFVRRFNALPEKLRVEVKEKIAAFKDLANHKSLKVHKLSGRLDGRFAFSVDYRTRIIFRYLSTTPREAYLLTVGNHDIYDR